MTTLLPAAASPAEVVVENSKGLIHLNVQIEPDLPMTMPDLETIFDGASRILLDATDGHFQIGRVVFAHTFGVSHADIRIDPTHSSAQWDGDHEQPPNGEVILGVQSVLGGVGLDDQVDFILAHELGHLMFGLGDEYPAKLDSECHNSMYDWCVPSAQTNRKQFCIMSAQPGKNYLDDNGLPSSTPINEFCVPINHDISVVNGNFCIDEKTSRSHQSGINNGESCWETIARHYDFVTIPAEYPVEAAPAGSKVIEFIDARPVTVVFLLDRSGSMAQSGDASILEVCGNGRDDDGDGDIDESECSDERIKFAKAALSGYLNNLLHESLEDGVDYSVGLVSFSSAAHVEVGIGDIGTAAPAIQTTLSNTLPSGLTALGDGLKQAASDLQQHRGTSPHSTHRVVLYTDGYWNMGADPIKEAQKLVCDGAIVDVVATGTAVYDETLSQIRNAKCEHQQPQNLALGYSQLSNPTRRARTNRGVYVANKDADFSVILFEELWARYHGNTIIPGQRFHVRQPGDGVPRLHEIPRDAWFTGDDGFARLSGGAALNRLHFLVPPTSKAIRVILAGTTPNTQDLDVNITLLGPDGVVRKLDDPGPHGRTIRSASVRGFHIINPSPGEWKIDVANGGSHLEQTGYISVVSRDFAQRLDIRLSDHKVSASDHVEITVRPIHERIVNNLNRIEARVIDPTGGIQSVPLVEGENGELRAVITNLAYTGMHEISVLAKSDSQSWRFPMEFSSEAGPIPVPEFQIGGRETFFVIDGIDVSPPLVPED